MWDPTNFNLRDFDYVAGVILTCFQRGTKVLLHIVNICAPYLNRRRFWDRIDAF